MATTEEVKKLAALARINISDTDLETKTAKGGSSGAEEAALRKFTSEFDAILAYVGQIETLDLPQDLEGEKPALRNVMRPDGEPHAAYTYTEKVAAQFPAREGDALVVKQIITHE
jgi:Asp-tRNA(Asn)/Glu-tRNA(Gln) amidotransferase C subunit